MRGLSAQHAIVRCLKQYDLEPQLEQQADGHVHSVKSCACPPYTLVLGYKTRKQTGPGIKAFQGLPGFRPHDSFHSHWCAYSRKVPTTDRPILLSSIRCSSQWIPWPAVLVSLICGLLSALAGCWCTSPNVFLAPLSKHVCAVTAANPSIYCSLLPLGSSSGGRRSRWFPRRLNRTF